MYTYVILGFFDAFAVAVLMLKLYRFPLWEYKIEVGVFALWIAVCSLFIRVIVDVPSLDPLIQIILFVLFLRYVIKVRITYSALITLTGFLGYIIIQMVIYYLFDSLGISKYSDAIQTTGFGTHVIQITSIIAGFIVAAVLKLTNAGFSFIIRPPHDTSVKDKNLLEHKVLWITISCILAAISISFSLLLHMNSIYVIPLLVASFGILYYLSYRRELKLIDRNNIAKNIIKNQKR